MRSPRELLRDLWRLHGTPRGIAGGFALGLGCSLVPIPAAGMIVALVLAPRLGFHLAATYLGSAVVNPLTGPPIYFAELWIGARLLGWEAPRFAALAALDAAGWWRLFVGALPPFLLGGGTLAALVGGGAWLGLRAALARRGPTNGPTGAGSSDD